MPKTLTFLDSNVLIAAATGRFNYTTAALSVLQDPAREFASSPFVRLEIVPKAAFHRKPVEVAFYEDYFSDCVAWDDEYDDLVSEAEKVGRNFGLSMGDALHIAAAIRLGAAEFITGERPTSPLKNVSGIHVLSIYQP